MIGGDAIGDCRGIGQARGAADQLVEIGGAVPVVLWVEKVVGAPATAAPSTVSVVVTARLLRFCGSVITRLPPVRTALAPTVVSLLMALIRSCTVGVGGIGKGRWCPHR